MSERPRIVQVANDHVNGITVVLTDDGRLWRYQFDRKANPFEWFEEWSVPFKERPHA